MISERDVIAAAVYGGSCCVHSRGLLRLPDNDLMQKHIFQVLINASYVIIGIGARGMLISKDTPAYIQRRLTKLRRLAELS